MSHETEQARSGLSGSQRRNFRVGSASEEKNRCEGKDEDGEVEDERPAYRGRGCTKPGKLSKHEESVALSD